MKLMKKILFIFLFLPVFLAAQNRLHITQQLQKSVVPGSIPITAADNQQYYQVPGANGSVLSVVAGIPTWAPATGGNGECEEKIYAPAHGLTVGTRGFEMIHFTGTTWVYANTTTDVLSHDAYLIGVPHVDSLLVRHCGYFERVAGDGLVAGTHYWLNDAGGVSSTADAEVDALICLTYANHVAFYPPRTFAAAGGATTLFQISDNTVFTNVEQGNIIRFLDTAPFNVSLTGLNYTLSWATPPTTGGTTQQVLQFDDVTDTYSWIPTPAGGGGSMTNFIVTDGTTPQTIADGNTLTFIDGGNMNFTTSATDNVTIGWAVAPTTGGATQQVLTFNDAGDTYTWTNLTTIADQTVTIAGAGISVVTGTYPNFTITSTEVDGSITNELITAFTYTASTSLLRITEAGVNRDVTLPNMVGATAGTAGVQGLVPAPAAGQQTFFLQGNGTWAAITQDQTVTITGGGINVVTGTYPNFTITGTEVDGSITNERITAYTYTAATGLMRITEGGTNFDITVPVMVGATAGVAGIQGLVPTPAAGQQLSFLRGDGTWATPAGGGTMSSFVITDGTTPQTINDGNTITFVDGGNMNFTTSATDNVTINWAVAPTTGGATQQVMQFNDVTDTYSWVTIPVGDQTVAITGAGISVVTGTYPNFTITSTEVDGSITNERITAHTYTAATGVMRITENGTNFDATIPAMVGATAGVAGVQGLVPAPTAGQQLSFLRGDGTWATVTQDQTVTITGGGINVVTGTYPNFTITATEVDGSITNERITAHTYTAASALLRITEGGTNFDVTLPDLVGATAGAAGVHGLVPSPAAGQQLSFLRGDGTWVAVTSDQTVTIAGAGINVVTGTYPNFTITGTEVDGSITNERITAFAYTAASGLLRITEGGTNFDVTIPVMVGATAGVAGTRGLVPTPAAGQQLSFLRGDGTWAAAGSSQWTLTVNNLTPVNGTATTLSIGTATATVGKLLTVAGDVDIQGVLDPTKLIFSDGVTTSYNPATLNRYEVEFQAGRDLNFRSNTTNDILHLENTGNVGVGINNPSLAKLEVNGKIRMTTGAAVGHIITSDANGVMSWGAPGLDRDGMFSAVNDGGTWVVNDFTTAATASFMSLGADFTVLHGTSDRVWRNTIEGNFPNTAIQTWQLATGNRVADINYGDDEGFIFEAGNTFILRARSSTTSDIGAAVIQMLAGDQSSNLVTLGGIGTNVRILASNHTAAVTGTTLVKGATGNVTYEVPLAPSVLTGNIISPPALAAANANYAPANFADAKILRLTTTGNSTISGIAGGAVGRVIYVQNVGASNITLQHANAGSTAANRFSLANNANIIIRANGGVTIWYDATSSVWRAVTP